jgi:hypothetical protein
MSQFSQSDSWKLIDAAQSGDVVSVQNLIEEGANVNYSEEVSSKIPTMVLSLRTQWNSILTKNEFFFAYL